MKGLLFGTALTVFVYSLFLFTVRHTPSVPSIAEIIAALLYWPALVGAVVVTLASLVWLALPRNRALGILCIVLCLPLLAGAGYERVKDGERERWGSWHQLAAQLTPLLGEYYSTYPERFRYLAGDTEEVIINGFPEFAQARHPELKLAAAKGRRSLRDPWGDPVCFVVSRQDNETIDVRGMHADILFGGGDERLFNNPHGLGIARFSGPNREHYQGYQDPVIVYMDARWSQQSIRDHHMSK
jgi:hypothetical protein